MTDAAPAAGGPFEHGAGPLLHRDAWSRPTDGRVPELAIAAACLRGPPLDHRQHEPPIERPARQPSGRRIHGLEERHLRLLESGRLDVRVEGRGRPVVGRDVVPASHPFSWSLGQPRLPCPK